jgi:hypothetical protein
VSFDVRLGGSGERRPCSGLLNGLRCCGVFPPYPPGPLSTPNGAERGSEVHILRFRFGCGTTGCYC